MADKAKSFLITIDNEEDDQWNYEAAGTTRNAEYLPRFQSLCEKYGFKPVYLTTYNMAQNSFFVEFAKDALRRNQCEIGMHLHAWCTPPFYELKHVTENRSYLTEYPVDIMEEKIKRIDGLLSDTFERKSVSHRSGRWALNSEYIRLLEKYGYQNDCSVTPGVNWARCLGETGMKGNDYSKEKRCPHLIGKQLWEFPVTIRRVHFWEAAAICSPKTFVKEVSHLLIGKQTWLRPSVSSIHEMGKLMKAEARMDEYAMFMMHSSELMPGGSKYFKNENDIECLYDGLEMLFDEIAKKYKGQTLEAYAAKYCVCN